MPELDIYSGIALILIILLISLLIINRKKQSRKPAYTIDEIFLENLIAAFGTWQNIISIEVDYRRLKVSVENLNLVDLATIKSLGASGVFVSGKQIKALFKHEPQILKKRLEEKKKGAESYGKKV